MVGHGALPISGYGIIVSSGVYTSRYDLNLSLRNRSIAFLSC